MNSNDDEDDLRGAIEVVLMMNKNEESTEVPSRKKSADSKLEDLPLQDLYILIDQHKGCLKFLQENNICSPEEKADVLSGGGGLQ